MRGKMITTIISFIIVGLAFFLLNLMNIKIWAYYIPFSLIFALFWLRIYNNRYKSLAHNLLKKYPDLFEDEIDKEIFLASPSVFLPFLELLTTFARLDFSSTCGLSLVISASYGVVSLVRGELIVVFLCAIIIYDTVFGSMRNAFDTANHEQNTIQVVHRYLKSKNKSIKEISDIELDELIERYEDIINRLKTYEMS